MNMINPISKTKSHFDVQFATSNVIATTRKYRHRFATGAKLILFKKCLLHRPGFGHQIAGAPDCVFCIDSI